MILEERSREDDNIYIVATLRGGDLGEGTYAMHAFLIARAFIPQFQPATAKCHCNVM